MLEIDDKFKRELKKINYTSALRLGLYDIKGMYMDRRRGLFANKPLPTFITEDFSLAGGKIRGGFDILFKKIVSAVAATSLRIALSNIFKIMKVVYETSIMYAPYDTGTLRSSAKLTYNGKTVGTCSANDAGYYSLKFVDLNPYFQKASDFRLKKNIFAISFRRVKGEIPQDYPKSGKVPEQFDIAMFLHQRTDWEPRHAKPPAGPRWLERALTDYSSEYKKALDKVVKQVRKDSNIIFRRFDQRK